MEENVALTNVQLKRCVEVAVAYLCLLLLIAWKLAISYIGWEIVLVPLCALDLRVVYKSVLYMRRPIENWFLIKRVRLMYFKDILDSLIHALAKVLLCLHIRGFASVHCIPVPLYAGWLKRLLLTWPRHECHSFSSLVRGLGKTIRILLVFSTTMKVAGAVKWSWITTFWPFWVFFTLVLLINLGVCLLFVG